MISHDNHYFSALEYCCTVAAKFLQSGAVVAPIRVLVLAQAEALVGAQDVDPAYFAERIEGGWTVGDIGKRPLF